MAGSKELIYKHSVVDGIVFPPHVDQQRMDEVKDLQLRPEDLFIVTYPQVRHHVDTADRQAYCK